MTVVLWAPVADADRRVDHDRGRLVAVRQRGRVDIWLERGAGLTQRVGCAVELALAVVAPADHCAYRAVEIDYDGGGLSRLVVVAVLADHRLDGVLRLALQIDVEAEPHREHPIMDRFRERR